MTPDEKRCVVTGLGVICAVGNNVEETWKSALDSVSGIHKTTSVDTVNCYADLAAEVKCDTLDNLDAPEEKDRVSKLCIKAANEALSDAGLSNFEDDQRVSVVIGSCVGGVLSIEQYHQHGRDASEIAKMPIAAIASQTGSEEIRRLADDIRYSDPMSSEGLADVGLVTAPDQHFPCEKVYHRDREHVPYDRNDVCGYQRQSHLHADGDRASQLDHRDHRYYKYP